MSADPVFHDGCGVPQPPPARYILVTPRGVRGYADRPTQDTIKALGEGEYTLHRADGQTLKVFQVTRNRNRNLSITAHTPHTLPGLSTLNLERLLRYYERIVKIWPEQDRAVRAVRRELDDRQALVSTVPLRPADYDSEATHAAFEADPAAYIAAHASAD